MKIKEVSEKTELTERAIRLYIESGLVNPCFSESYTGRRSIDFSQEDVEILKNVSVLRKAGFSISEISTLQQHPEKSKEILSDFIKRTENRIQTDTEIVACLKPLLEHELNVEKISMSLNKPSVKEKDVPSEDSELSPLQNFMRRLLFGLGIAGMIFSGCCYIPIFRVEAHYIKEYLYPRYDFELIFIFVILSAILPFVIVFLNRKKGAAAGKGLKIKTAASVLSVCLYVWSAFFLFAMAFLASISSPEGYVQSHTDKRENYMIFDSDAAEKAMAEFLPAQLPDTDGISYEYYYKDHGVVHEPPATVVLLEIPLDDEAFYEAVEYYEAFRPADSTGEPVVKIKNDWTVIFYRQKYECAPSDYEPIFAFNEKEHKIRFICEYGRTYLKGARNNTYYFEW